MSPWRMYNLVRVMLKPYSEIKNLQAKDENDNASAKPKRGNRPISQYTVVPHLLVRYCTCQDENSAINFNNF